MFKEFMKKLAKHYEAWPFPSTPVPYLQLHDFNLVEHQKPKVWEVRVCYEIGYKNKGGVTIAYRPCENFANSRMVEVAVAYCSPHDTFSKKIGRSRALANFHNGETVKVPARHQGRDLPSTLRTAFWDVYCM